ncbi:protein phosphatase 1 regulatory subunit 35-like [Boleophthalmus pectinirostris]|uniref:protein phosphatase 1 regulatory subunit 35-like n=1 Tax=Boleophthalmus pectinirostris TaxID=150288 RepID=UPI00242EF619|nr:protein phosphatase 1 regulatory subunit 35-like [Boleophthalmus pectinirostris]
MARTEMARKASLSLLEAVAMVTEPGSDAESDVDTFYTDEELDYLEDLDPIEDAESEDVPQAPPDSPVPFTSGVSPASSVSITPATRPEPSTPSTPTISSESRRRGRDGGHGRSRSPLLSTSSPSPHLLTTTPGRPQQARIIWEAVMCALLTNTG